MNVWVEKYVNDDWVKISDTEVHYEGQGHIPYLQILQIKVTL